jgi:hypothetical protein
MVVDFVYSVSAVMAVGKRPVTIPNPAAKPTSADGTAPETVWESRTPPNKTSQKPPPTGGGFFIPGRWFAHTTPGEPLEASANGPEAYSRRGSFSILKGEIK